MCGIFGFSAVGGIQEVGVHRLRQGLATLAHRGPDNSSEYSDEHVYLGHRRLSIIDLSAMANQPFKSARYNAWIIFNGEIYNYKELSRSLTGLTTTSDTEVILEGYLRDGKSFFDRLRGIYAFAIYDFRNEPQLILFRDRAGIKPLYFSLGRRSLSFASEIKALKAIQPGFTINEPILKSYLALGYCLEPETIYREVNALKPGELITYSVRSAEVQTEIISVYQFTGENSLDFRQNLERTRELLEAAVQRNLTADVPLSFSLSGGIDSSLVLALSKSDSESICIKFGDQQYDESTVAQRYADRLHRKLSIIPAEVHASLDLVNKLFLHFDQPYSDSSAIPFYILSKSAAKKTKVLLGGDGGDEIQNGYPSFQWLPEVYRHRSLAGALTAMIPPVLPADYRRAATRIREISQFNSYEDAICTWNAWLPPVTRFEGKSPFTFDPQIIYDTYSKAFGPVNESDVRHGLVRNFFYKRMLSDYLRKSDMMSMMNSLEYRVPMLDEDLVTHSLTIPYAQKSDRRTSKKILRTIHAGIFSKEDSYAKKQGFGIPLDRWLSKEDFRFMRSAVMGNNSIVTNYVRKDYLDFLFDSLERPANRMMISRAAVYQRILMMYVLQIWHSNTYLSTSPTIPVETKPAFQ